MNNAKEYNRNKFKEEFLKLYNSNEYNFEISDDKISYLINKWKHNSNKYTKFTILGNIKDYKGNLYLRDYRQFFVYEINKKAPVLYEYCIWGNNGNLIRMARSQIWFIDETFHHKSDFEQLLIIQYKDYITSNKIVSLYILMNKKIEYLYNIVFKSILNFVTQNNN